MDISFLYSRDNPSVVLFKSYFVVLEMQNQKNQIKPTDLIDVDAIV